MTTKGKHQKHPKLVRSTIGHYHRSEFAIYGTTCDEIKLFFDQITERLSRYNLLYVDADHGDTEKDTRHHIGKKQFSINKVLEWNEFDDRLNSLTSDAAFINGNHYQGSRQIVIINPEKVDSLKRRIDQIDNISLVIIEETNSEIFDFVKLKMDANTIVLKRQEIRKIVKFVEQIIINNIPLLKAAILVGGKSQRMGTDKSKIEYHNGINQEDYLYQLLRLKGIDSYLSKRYDHNSTDESKLVIKDRFLDMGPFGAIVSAMMTDPNAAWLIIACDLPFLDEGVIDQLIDARNPSKFATAFRGSENPFPEPLITIYEPRAYQRFLSFLSLGYACPRKVLINSDIEEIVLEDTIVITNANTPEEMEQAKSKIANG